MIPGCKPGRGCLTCELPPDACNYSGPKVFNEERQMVAAVGRETLEHGRKSSNKKGRSCANRNDLDKTHT